VVISDIVVFRNCAFVNFTNISNAIKAIDSIKIKPEYANLRIAHGKDRCANPPRSGPQGGSSVRRSASGNGPGSAEPVSAIEPLDSSQFVAPEDDGINANVIVSGPEEMEASI
jgi:hypothetical protein